MLKGQGESEEVGRIKMRLQWILAPDSTLALYSPPIAVMSPFVLLRASLYSSGQHIL